MIQTIDGIIKSKEDELQYIFTYYINESQMKDAL